MLKLLLLNLKNYLIKILHEIKLYYPLFNHNLYEKILRYLKYIYFFEIKKNQHYVIDELAISLKNTFIYEMFNPL